MFLQRFYDDSLAQASYLVGCAATGEALVVDPSRDVGQYVEIARREGLRVTHVTETHIHADFVSGARELAAATGARLLLSGEGGAEWQYAYAAADGATLLRDGDVIHVGNVRVQVMHTPGHTPEHLCFVVTDTAAADRPMGVFTGDFIFVGAVGRPDLLERAVQQSGTMEKGARELFASLQRFKAALPDWVQLWPGHGAGSACGKSLGAVPTTTLGYETLFNRGLAEADEAAFVADVLAGQPEPPMYFAEMKRMNREGPRVLGALPRPARRPDAELAEVLRGGGIVVDARPAPEFARRHVPGTLNVPLGKNFPTWAGSVLAYDRRLPPARAGRGGRRPHGRRRARPGAHRAGPRGRLVRRVRHRRGRVGGGPRGRRAGRAAGRRWRPSSRAARSWWTCATRRSTWRGTWRAP